MQKSFYYNSAKNARIYKKSIDFSPNARKWKYIPKDKTGWKRPTSVVAIEVEKETYPAQLPSQYTPADMRITELFVRGIDKQLVGEFAANVRKIRKPEPYKGKGIRYADEHIRRKEGKKASK